MSEAAPRNPYVRSRPPGGAVYLAAAIVVLPCLAALIHLVLLEDTIGPFSYFGSVASPPIDLTRPARLALVSDAGAYESPLDRQRRLERWRRAAAAAGLPVEHVSSSRLASSAALRSATVLALPALVSLDEASRAAVLAALDAGTGVVASGALGARDAGSREPDLEFVRRLTGAARADVAPEGVSSVTFSGGRFFSDSIPPGRRLELPAQDLVLLRTKSADAFLSDQELRPQRGKTPEEVALAVHGMRGAGRFVWFGFDETVLPEHPFDQLALDAYLSAALRWASRHAVAVRGTWPGDRVSAVLVAAQLEAGGEQAEGMLRVLREHDVPTTFFVGERLVRESPELVRRLREAGEVGSAADSEEPLVGLPPAAQAERLRRTRSALERVTGERVLGLSPPQGLANSGTVTAMNQAGHGYYINDRSVSQAVPEIVEFQQSVLFPLQKAEVTKLYRTAPDDLELFALTEGDPVPRCLAESNRVAGLGGLFALHIHDDLLGGPAQRGNFARLLQALRASPAWLARGDEIVRWWSGRHKVEVGVQPLGPRRLQLEVANKGQKDVDDVVVRLHLPYRPLKVGIRSPVFRLAPPQHSLDGADGLLRLRFARLERQTSRLYYVTLDE